MHCPHVAAAGAGGCGEGCAVEPIPGGFPIDERIENAAQFRLTESGINFLENNAGALVESIVPGGLEFPVPRTMQSVLGGTVNLDLCPDEDCRISAKINELTMTPTEPNRLSVGIRLELESRRCTDESCDETEQGPLFATTRGPCVPLVGCDTGELDLHVDTKVGERPDIGLVASVDFVEETQAAREGYTKIIVNEIGLEDDHGFEGDDIDIDGRGGIVAGLINAVEGFARRFILGLVQGQINDLIRSQVENQLCTRTGETGCPTGTFSDDPEDSDSFCRFEPEGECVPTLLGMDGQGDLGVAALGGISPGTHAPGQFLLASGGEAEARDNGLSLFLYGGLLGTTRDFLNTPAHNPCVPAVDPPPLPEIPRITAFRSNSISGISPDPHVGIGISESFLNQVGYGMYDSGLLCIGAGTPLSQQLSSGLFSLLVRSINDLAFPLDIAPISIVLRPQTPPTFEIGAGNSPEDPLMEFSLEQVNVDFYVWSHERFVRFMTFETDLTAAINLTVRDAKLVPEIVTLSASNSSVTNQEILLTEDPEELAMVLQDIISGLAGSMFAEIEGFDLPDLMGLELQIDETGIRGIEEDGEEFLGIFAGFALRSTTKALSFPTETYLEISGVDFDPKVMTVENWGQGKIPSVDLFLEAEGPAGLDYEFSYRVDQTQWSEWTTDRELQISNRLLLFQARHTIEARARIVGSPESVDRTPASVEVLIDILPPTVELEQAAQGMRVVARDILAERMELRFRSPNGQWSAWETLKEDHVLDIEYVEVEVRDEAGNIGSASNALIRGRPNPDVAGGCGCDIPGQSSGAPFAGLLGLLIFCFIRRKRASHSNTSRVPLSFFLFLLSGVLGCNCNPSMPKAGDASTDGMDARLMGPLDEGYLATHLDMDITTSGDFILSGYSPGSVNRRYGDLVLGKWNASAQAVEWEIVDGLPMDAPITHEPSGYRGGISAAGDDVGTFTSVGVDDSDRIQVSYFDATHGALKFASGSLGGSWGIHTVDDDGWAGAYSSLVLRSSGIAIAYMAIEPPTSLPGQPSSEVRIAMASDIPSGVADWVISSLGRNDMECRPQFCPEGSSCLERGQCVMPTDDCSVECETLEVCVEGSCEPYLVDSYVEARPPAVGLFNSIANTPDGELALVYYDRTRGDIMGAEFDGTRWSTFLIDGYSVGDPDIGDSGIGASLIVDAAGVWHVAYVDGTEEVLRYARIDGGEIETETIDDGTSNGVDLHPDGRHIVGDDSSIVVTAGGEIRVVYQDATVQHTMIARKSDGEWNIQVADNQDSNGYFTRQALLGDTSYVAHWWRRQVEPAENGIRILAVE